MRSTLTVIIPIYNDSANLALCYRALSASTRLPDLVIVADDGSSEPLPAPPDGLRVRVTRLEPGPQGSYVARNRAVDEALAAGRPANHLLVFVDADVAVHPDALERIERFMEENPSVTAVFGSYDDAPGDGHWVSRYKNLLHHWVHQHGAGEAGTFWTGLGTIRCEALQSAGGFDTSADTLRDIELGMRLRRAGLQIRLAPEIQGTHLKRWTFMRMLRSDILDRAVPWTRMIVRARNLSTDLNLARESRAAAVLAWAAAGLLLAALWHPAALAGALATLAGVAALNRRLYAFMYRRGGALFGLGAAALHLLYLLYGSATFVLVAAHTLWRDRRRIRSGAAL
jgi:cellulose synthase/poly-beta-1,6-N-acetylglucosamine synthase-like glycosyltransferase